jgi:hypothetical protein
MIEKGLLNIAGNNRTITGKGLEIVNFGGWVAYRRQLQKEKPRTLYAFETSFRKHEAEITSLKKEIQEYKAQLQKQSEKDSESTMMIANLIEQNKQSKIMTFVSGVAVGLLVASALSALLI